MTVHIVKSARPGKPVTWYIYAWRGGPQIRSVTTPRKPSLTANDHAAIAQAHAAANAPDPTAVRTILRKWSPMVATREGSVEWEGLADSTKRVWTPHVDAIEAKWGKFPIGVFADPRMVAKVVAWRDERAAQPRTADMRVEVLRAFLDFARLRGHVPINVARDIPSLYHGGDRSEIIWTPDDMAAFATAAEQAKKPQINDLLRLAAVTGLRRSDLVTLTWDQVGEFAIVKKALKISRRKRRRVVIPQTPQLAALLEELRTRYRRPGVDTVLVNSLGKSWTHNSIGVTFGEIRNAAGIVHVDEEGERRNKTLHDVRGTFCTMLLTEWELTDDEAAEVMGWSPTRVARIRRVYVDHLRVVVALAERIAVKQNVKHISSDAAK